MSGYEYDINIAMAKGLKSKVNQDLQSFSEVKRDLYGNIVRLPFSDFTSDTDMVYSLIRSVGDGKWYITKKN
jgi:hypothetical protein